ncbi:hypothetical protein HHK36_001416 [Tetracentron sinense]|uniref:Ethylene-responsive nuclear protein n=1 Tax=Tetracentron sinense TaxID=13715 RepID=A0A835DS06_TETSI|nr:hypothetical protein HHK36_001416 [Tetracentron sinense]
MPLPWKKAKVSGISRFVSDLQSSKRGGSLVVQTGFPTSLIDLIVKNRNRLKKQSKKKPMESSDPLTPSSNSTFSAIPVIPAPDIKYHRRRTGEEILPSISNEISTLVAKEVEDVVDVSVPNGVFMVVLKLFFMLILALGTKKLAIGITVSAFALMFLEFVGKRVFCFLKPCANAQRNLMSVMERVLLFVHPKKGLRRLKETPEAKELIGVEETVVTDTSGLSEVAQAKASIEEGTVVTDTFGLSEVAQAKASIEEIQILESDMDLLSRERRWGSTELDQKERILGKDDYVSEVRNLGPQRTSSAKLKAKLLKKLVPKKFRGSKNRRNSKEIQSDSSSDLSISMVGEKLVEGEQKEEDEQGELEDEEKSEEDNEVDSSLEKNSKEDDEVDNSCDVSQIEMNPDVAKQNVGRKAEESSGYLIIFVIVLVGLVGGRVMALVTTIAWCLVVKTVGTVRRFSKVFQIRSPL